MRRKILSWLGVFSACAVACTSEQPLTAPGAPAAPAQLSVTTVDGQAFELSALRGQVVLLTFGYTSCPDVCPLTLSRARAVLKRLGARAEQVQLVFVSVDPARDTPKRLHDYVTGFDSRFMSLALDPQALALVASRFEVVINRRMPDPRRYADRPAAQLDDYAIDHTGGFVVIDKEGRLRARMPHSARVERLVDAISPLLKEVR